MIKLNVTLSLRAPKGRFPKGDLTAVLEVARDGMAADMREAFDRKADPVTGKPWPARAGGGSHPLLVKTGRLKAATLRAAKAATIRGATVSLNLSVPRYARFHMTGTKRMPRRRFAGVNRKTLARVRRRLTAAGRRNLSVYQRRG